MVMTYFSQLGVAYMAARGRAVFRNCTAWVTWSGPVAHLDDTQAIHYLMTGELP
jgi:hypothetical protein